MSMACCTSDAKAIMGTKPAVAWVEAGPPGTLGLKVSQLSAAPILSYMPGFMPLLKATAFIRGGQPEAPVSVVPVSWVPFWPLPGGSWARPSKPTVRSPGVSWVGAPWAGVAWAELDWAELAWVELDWAELTWVELALTELTWAGASWMGEAWAELLWVELAGSAARPFKPTPRSPEDSWTASFPSCCPGLCRRVHLAETLRAKRQRCSKWYILNESSAAEAGSRKMNVKLLKQEEPLPGVLDAKIQGSKDARSRRSKPTISSSGWDTCCLIAHPDVRLCHYRTRAKQMED